MAATAITMPVLRRSTIRAVLEGLERYDFEDEYRYNQALGVIRFDNGSQLDFISAEIPPEQQQGPNLGLVIIDEGESYPEPHFERMVSRVRQPGTPQQIRVFSNPPHRDHWLPRRFGTGEEKLGPIIQSTTYENVFLDDRYLRRLEKIYVKGSNRWRRYMMGEIGLPMEGAVYPEFSISEHVVGPEFLVRNPPQVYIGGLDLGANHPTAYLQIALCDDDIMVVTGEYWARDLPIAQHVEAIKSPSPHTGKGIYQDGMHVWSDWQRQDRIEYEALGIPTFPAPKEIGVETGIELVRRRLISERLFFLDGACPRLIEEMQTYLWARPRVVGGVYKDAPVKIGDDVVDALRYAVSGYDVAFEDPMTNTALLRQVFAPGGAY